MKRGEELRLTVERFAAEGKTVARLEGLVVFVHGGVPGDDVRVRVSKVKKSFLEAEVTQILSPSPLRIEPRCRYFGLCGGCRWQHVQYAAQLDFKRQHVLDALERIGGFHDVEVQPVAAADSPYFYRNKMEFSFGERWLTREELSAREGAGGDERDRFALGLHIPLRFDRVLDLHECHLQSETSQKIVNTVRSFCLDRKLPVYSTVSHTGFLRNLVIRESRRTGERMVNLVTNDERPALMEELRDLLLREVPDLTSFCNNITQRKSLVAVGDTETVYHGAPFITERLGGKQFRISANSFFQTNTEQAERLYETVRRAAHLQARDVVFDLYSGTGSIALFIADDVAEVLGIESVESAVRDAERNAALNGVRNCKFLQGDLKDMLSRDTAWLAEQALPSVVILDPPRSGAHEKVIDQVLQLKPERIVYVSCNPATQARDLALLCAHGEYRVQVVQPVDMFPQTSHVESVVSLARPAA
jgi:23S rRNA (uracil1939-C5)-methyltransferase